ncbi:ABC-F family ATP-binding cassette domain-containing protein [Phenylobacterium conjunctum]|uniref:ABC-F family ATP-binding cassette domain-containing protein n=1 Tax=Phenylobacterium conjunctum TaxID=1298959 RepID=A0ABW3T7H5_9CAUL
MSRQAVLGVENASFFYGSNRVFENVTFQLDDARTALVGDNGAGKSTLLKCLLGELELNSGKIVKSRGLKIGYVPQEAPAHLLDQPLRRVLEQALTLDDGSEDWKVDVLLDEVGLSYDDAERPFSALSGGWRRLMLIAAAMRLSEPDLLILDEPTNHLDLSNINTLEAWLAEDARLPMLVVSHDRAFLQRATTRTLFLRADGAHSFNAPFVAAREALLERDAADAARRQLEAKEIERLQKVVARYKVWGIKNDKFDKRAKATEKRIERIEAERTEAYAARERRLELHDGEIDAKVALRIHDHVVRVPDGSRDLFRIDRLSVAAGDKIALLGVNGAGKSTLLSALAQAFDPEIEHYDGQAPIRFNPQARLVYFDQRLADLPLTSSLIDYLTSAEGATEREANALLAKAGFAYVRIKGPIADLSHGERARLAFLRMQLAKPNLYLLDEPTNHLDIEGQEALEAQLEASDVACLFVSHDRYFTRSAATRFLEIRKGRLIEVEDPEAFFAAQ